MDWMVFDIETTAKDPWQGDLLCGAWSTSWGEEAAASSLPDHLIKALGSPSVAKVSQGLFDPRWFKLQGIEVNGPYHNLMVMAHLLDENQPFDIEAMSKRWLGQKMDKRLKSVKNVMYLTLDDGSRVKLSEISLDSPEWEVLRDYCLRDVLTSRDLYLALREQLQGRFWEHDWVSEHVPLTEIVVDMETTGLPINLTKTQDVERELSQEASRLEADLTEQLGFSLNWRSPTQLREIMFSKLWNQSDRFPNDAVPDDFEVLRRARVYSYGYHVRRGLGLEPTPLTEKSKVPSTSTPALIATHPTVPFVQTLIQWRKVDTILKFLPQYEEHTYNGRLYGRVNQTGTVTGRFSSSEPNLQNIAARGRLGDIVRGLFEGNLIVGDHGQLEPRLMAHFSQDPVLLDTFRKGKDLYLVTADGIFGGKHTKDDTERFLCKTLILALGYGAGADKVAQLLTINGYPTDKDTAQGYLNELQLLYKGFFSWKRVVSMKAKQDGYVRTLGGRFRRLTYAYGDAAWKVRNKADRQASNAIIQGSAADILRRNMLHTRDIFRPLALLIQVHDELVWEHPDNYPYDNLFRIADVCQKPGYNLSVPLKFEVGFCKTWAEKGADAIELPEEEEEDETVGV